MLKRNPMNLEDNIHISYKDYKKSSNDKKPSDLTIFCAVFIVSVLVILGIARILSPNVDLGIATNDEESEIYDPDNSTNIDDRLNNLKNEDDGKVAKKDDDMFSPELDEKVILPIFTKKATPQETQNPQIQDNTTATKQEAKAPQTTTPTQAKPTSFKVVVGYYSTEKQAEVAKSIMMDTGITTSPVVKNFGGYYSLQMGGAYSSREKAQQAVNDLLRNNFPARILSE